MSDVNVANGYVAFGLMISRLIQSQRDSWRRKLRGSWTPKKPSFYTHLYWPF